MSQNLSIRFPDLAERDKTARDQLVQRQKFLAERKRPTTAERGELDRVNALLKRLEAAPKREVADPLWVALRDNVNQADDLFGRVPARRERHWH